VVDGNGVRVLYHRPAWDKESLNGLRVSTESEKKTSHLYSDEDMVLSTFFRLDIPVIPEISQFEHAFYTDTDVYFRKDIPNLRGTGARLPGSIQMGLGAMDMFLYNAGIFLASVHAFCEPHIVHLSKR
jgi:hypothetical protein